MPLRRRKEEPWAPPARPWRVLVTCDDRVAAELLARIVRAEGHIVGLADSGGDTVQGLLAHPVHAVVLDLRVAGAGGNLVVLDQVRSHHDPAVSGARVLLCAGKGANRLFAWESGIDAYLRRPFHARDLVAAVTAMVERPEDDRRRYRRDQRDEALTSGGRGG